MPSADDGVIFYQVEGVGREDLERALAAVRAMFDEERADANDCAAMAFRIEGGGRVSPRQRRLAGLWFGALAVANQAACGRPDIGGRRAEIGLVGRVMRHRAEHPSEYLLPHYSLAPIDDEIPW
jgi:hypothetical protein